MLSSRPPFSLRTVIRSHGWVGLAPFSHDPDDQTFSFAYRLDSGRVVELRVEPGEGGVQVTGPGRFSRPERDEVAERVGWMLGLDQDLSEFYALARKEPKLSHVRKQAQGRILRCPTLFEDTVKTILTTNTSWAGTVRMVDSLVSQFGEPLQNDPERRAFPTPERLAAADELTLRSQTGLGYRAPYVLELARMVAAGDRDLEQLKTSDMATDELREWLLAIKGVGGYAAANLLMLLGRYDYITIDSWARKLVSHEWYGGEPVSDAEVGAAFEDWGRWKGLAYWCWDWDYRPGG